VDLLTLSACETAVPAGVDARGSALESLAHVALLRGARQVLASLWTVPDEDTARLMGTSTAPTRPARPRPRRCGRPRWRGCRCRPTLGLGRLRAAGPALISPRPAPATAAGPAPR
jgi:hypothetical protein